MGAIHAAKIQELPEFQITAVIDPKESQRSKAQAQGYATFLDIESAYARHNNFDVVVITSNTAAHYKNILQIIEFCKTHDLQFPALFVENPIVATTTEATNLQKLLTECGYPEQYLFMCGYLLRESAAIPLLINNLRTSEQKILSIAVRWQKLRSPHRASAGIIQDDSTHALDLIRYILKNIGQPNSLENGEISIIEAKRSDKIVNIAEQYALYPEGDFNRKPLAEIFYTIKCGLIEIFGLSSFLRDNKRRFITFETADHELHSIEFDVDGADQYKGMTFKGDKIALQWQSLLHGLQTGQLPQHCATLDDACSAVRLSNILEESAKQRFTAPIFFSNPNARELQEVKFNPAWHSCCHALSTRLKIFGC